MQEKPDKAACPTCGKTLDRPLDDMARINAERAKWEIQRAEEQLEIDKLRHATILRMARQEGKFLSTTPLVPLLSGAAFTLFIIALIELSAR